MKMHRFFVSDEFEMRHNLWVHDKRLVHQWYRVLRFRPGQQVVLFDGATHDRLYRITEINEREAHLEHVTDFERQLPARDIYLAWSLLKKDKNDWVLQKATELGVSHFIPLLADRSEKTGFNKERAEKIIIEAAEQCGRSDIPSVREPMRLQTAVDELQDKAVLFICEQGSDEISQADGDSLAVLIGPEGGWSDEEKDLFRSRDLKHLNLHDFTLRAETAAVTAVSKLQQI